MFGKLLRSLGINSSQDKTVTGYIKTLNGYKKTDVNEQRLKIEISYPGRSSPPVPEDLLDKEYDKWKFITEHRPKINDGNDIWFDPLKKINKNAKRLPKWMEPILPKTDFDNDLLRKQLLLGPNNFNSIAIAVRKIIRAKRKEKKGYRRELDFLYRVAILNDLLKECVFPKMKGVGGANIVKNISKKGLENAVISYEKIGYETLTLLNKTDKKWLAESMGTPKNHRAVSDIFSEIINETISRHCWEHFEKNNELRSKLGTQPSSIQEDLKNYLRQYLGYSLEYQCEMEKDQARKTEWVRAKNHVEIKDYIEMFKDNFVVADLETIGLNPNDDAIIELAAIKVTENFSNYEKFTTLVVYDHKIPEKIVRLTGINDSMLHKRGVNISSAIYDFNKFVSGLPVFCHNASFDKSFLDCAYSDVGINNNIRFFDTLTLFRYTWPELPNHKLQTLCKLLSVDVGNKHRALSDCESVIQLIKLMVKKIHVEQAEV